MISPNNSSSNNSSSTNSRHANHHNMNRSPRGCYYHRSGWVFQLQGDVDDVEEPIAVPPSTTTTTRPYDSSTMPFQSPPLQYPQQTTTAHKTKMVEEEEKKEVSPAEKTHSIDNATTLVSRHGIEPVKSSDVTQVANLQDAPPMPQPRSFSNDNDNKTAVDSSEQKKNVEAGFMLAKPSSLAPSTVQRQEVHTATTTISSTKLASVKEEQFESVSTVVKEEQPKERNDDDEDVEKYDGLSSFYEMRSNQVKEERDLESTTFHNADTPRRSGGGRRPRNHKLNLSKLLQKMTGSRRRSTTSALVCDDHTTSSMVTAPLPATSASEPRRRGKGCRWSLSSKSRPNKVTTTNEEGAEMQSVAN